MTTFLKIPRQIYQAMMADLVRPHSFAFERIGFCRVRIGNRDADTRLIFVVDYWPVQDDQYIPDDFAGARINSHAIRAALQTAMNTGDGVLHVHMHDFPGLPGFSLMDREEIPRIVKSLTFANADAPHGMLLLGRDLAAAEVIMPGANMLGVDRISVVGHPTTVISQQAKSNYGDRFDRQGFLGPMAQQKIASVIIGIIGLSGGGSHIAQQLSHIGFRNFVLFEPQNIESSNLNRLVGATEADVTARESKVAIANRVVTNVNPQARVHQIAGRWQDHFEFLRICDIVFGCVDGFGERRQLEAACRRYLIPLIDIGMDIAPSLRCQPPRMAGQVILSLPGYPCLSCVGFLNDKTLTAEAQNYGENGPNPQVVWPNGVLASTAVGIAVNLVTNWTRSNPGVIYKLYDGNSGDLIDHPRHEYARNKICTHYKLTATGDP